MAGTHPDILRVQRPAEKTTIPIELLIGTRESRMQEGMCHDIRMTPMSGGRRIAIIDDCDFLEAQSANALLKTLEEPPPKAIIILIGTSLQRQLPTIRSRCQVVRFDLPSAQHAAQILRFRITEEELPEEEIQAALQLAEGNLAQATVYLDQSVRDFQKQLNGLLAQPIPEAVKLAKLVTQFVEAAGTEAPPRRERMRIVSDLAAAHYRERIREEGASRHINRLYRCMEIRQHVDRNINQATIIESWAEELQRG